MCFCVDKRCQGSAVRETQSMATFVFTGRGAVTCTRLGEPKFIFEWEGERHRACSPRIMAVCVWRGGEGLVPPYLNFLVRRLWMGALAQRHVRRLVVHRGGRNSIPGPPIGHLWSGSTFHRPTFNLCHHSKLVHRSRGRRTMGPLTSRSSNSVSPLLQLNKSGDVRMT